jgi:hypothetical protein
LAAEGSAGSAGRADVWLLRDRAAVTVLLTSLPSFFAILVRFVAPLLPGSV